MLGILFTGQLIGIFTAQGTELFSMSVHGYRLYSVCFLLAGVNVFASAMFTALSDGKVSAILSFFRTLFFITITILVLPLILGINGVWLAMPVAEVFSLGLSIYFFKKKRCVYNYA